MINFTNKPENLWQRPSTVFLDDFCFCQDGAKQRRNTGQRHQTGSEIWENRWRWKYDKYSGRYDRGMERRGRIIVGVEGFFGSATAVDKDLGIWVQLCFRDSTTTWWPTFFISSVKIKTRNSCWKLFPLFFPFLLHFLGEDQDEEFFLKIISNSHFHQFEMFFTIQIRERSSWFYNL